MKKIISFLLTALLLLSVFNIGAFAAGKVTFTGTLTSDAKVDLSGIKFDVYDSKRTYSDNDCEKYTHSFLFSVYSDKNGKFSFERPSGMFVIKADMSTLPKRTGISENMWVFTDSKTKKLSANVNKIKYINIDSTNVESGEIGVKIKSADRTLIYCDYTVDISDKEVDETVVDPSGIKTYKTKRTITVTANGTRTTQVVTDEYTETIIPTVSLVMPEYEEPCSYTEGGGFFTIHYDKGQYSLNTVKNVYAVFCDAKAYFDRLGFDPPKKEVGSEKYNVYLKTTGGAAATTKHVKNGTSYIVMLTPANYSRYTHTYQTSAIAHEVFHAIMDTYTYAYGVVPSKWFREGFANWAGNSYLNSSTETLRRYVNIFQSNPELSLTDTYDSRVYGSITFPLTIAEYYGGAKTIKTILEQFKNISPNKSKPEMDAISKGLSAVDKSYSRTKAFIRFAMNNMYPSYFYSLRDANKWDKAHRSADIKGSDTLRDLECQPLSTKYYDAAPNSSSKDLYITVLDNADKYSNIALCCVAVRSSKKHVDITATVKSFSTYRVKSFTSDKTSVASFGVINTSTGKTQDISVKVTYA